MPASVLAVGQGDALRDPPHGFVVGGIGVATVRRRSSAMEER